MEYLGYGAMALVAAAVGTLGGLGGAILLVPALVVTGMEPSQAAPLGLVTVAAASIAAGPHQLGQRSVNHRLGVAAELVASTGAVVGAVLSGLVAEQLLTYTLAGVALVAAMAGARRAGQRNPPDPSCTSDDVGERVGSLAGAYPLGQDVVPYQADRLGLGLGLMAGAGLIAGTAGVSGGFIKTAATSEVMGVPTKVAASTTTFTVGITAAAALVVFAVQGRIEATVAAVVIAGSLLGGRLGARLQSALSPTVVRRLLSGLLALVAVILVVRG